MSIPKIIHYCWFGGNPLPEDAKRYIESWKKFCPNYQIIEWNESNYDINKNQYAREAYEEKKWAFVSDYARFDIIYQYGGIYLDTDVEMIKNFDELLNQEAFMGFEDGLKVAPGLVMAATPQNSSIKSMMENVYSTRHFKRCDGTLDLTAIPKLVTEYLVNKGLICNNSVQLIDGIQIYPKDYFSPKDYLTGQVEITHNTYSIHQFSASWQTNKQKKWQSIERTIANKIGEARIKKLRSTFVWRGIGVVYTRGIVYCIKRIINRKSD